MVEYESEPPAAMSLFSAERLDLARVFTRNLALQGEALGLIGPLELPRLWTRHVLNSALVARLVRPGLVADVGSGAGLPGIPLAIARPDAQFVLIEPMERRTEWLRAQTDELGLSNVTVVRARAEDAPYLGRFDQLTARAVAALKTLIPAVVPLVKPGGELLLMKGARVDDERVAAAKQIAKARLHDVEVMELSEQGLAESTRVFRAVLGR